MSRNRKENALGSGPVEGLVYLDDVLTLSPP